MAAADLFGAAGAAGRPGSRIRGLSGLLQLLCQRRYDARERVYLFPYVACHVIEAEFRQGRLAEALAICERAPRELSQEKRLYAYECLLEWKQRLFTAMGRTEQEPQQFLHWLNVLCKPKVRPR